MYVYVITRLDIPQPHRTVQVGHGVLAATRSYGESNKAHPHMVVCAVQDEKTLKNVFESLKKANVPCIAWYEDDMDNQLTAVATGPLRGIQRKPLKKFRLLAN